MELDSLIIGRVHVVFQFDFNSAQHTQALLPFIIL